MWNSGDSGAMNTYWGGDRGKGHGSGSAVPAAQLAQQSTSKVPPYWDPSLELRGYPFRVWLQDINIWAAGTELIPQLQAPAVAQRLGGTARDLVREVPASELREGRYDGATGTQLLTGLELLLQGLNRRHG